MKKFFNYLNEPAVTFGYKDFSVVLLNNLQGIFVFGCAVYFYFF